MYIHTYIYTHITINIYIYIYIHVRIKPWPKGLVFLEALRECLRGSLRAAYTRVLLTRGPYCHKYD